MKEDILNAYQTLKSGGIILYPTDTIWGLGCDATNEEAVAKIYAIKKRDDSKSMLVLMNNINSIHSYIDKVPEIALDIAEIAEKPTTIIYPGAKNLAKNLVADDGTIGIRLTKELFTNKLIDKFRKPIVSTSANVSGENSPVNYKDISEEIKKSVDYIVKYKQDENVKSQPSSIIKVGLSNEIKVIRK
jgi:L-threonylcarbamoyladenylate synthase